MTIDMFYALLCVVVLSVFQGCYIDPALSGSTSVERGVGTYATPYSWE
jgi:hypothetical protein